MRCLETKKFTLTIELLPCDLRCVRYHLTCLTIKSASSLSHAFAFQFHHLYLCNPSFIPIIYESFRYKSYAPSSFSIFSLSLSPISHEPKLPPERTTTENLLLFPTSCKYISSIIKCQSQWANEPSTPPPQFWYNARQTQYLYNLHQIYIRIQIRKQTTNRYLHFLFFNGSDSYSCSQLFDQFYIFLLNLKTINVCQ